MSVNKKVLVKNLKEHINNCKLFNGNMDGASWRYQEGLVISGNEAKLFVKLLKGDKK